MTNHLMIILTLKREINLTRFDNKQVWTFRSSPRGENKGSVSHIGGNLMANKREYETIESAAPFRFEKEGDSIEGKYIGQRTVRIDDRDVLVYDILQDGETTPTGVFSSAVLARKMSAAVVGKYVKITYQGDQNLGRGKRLKLFDVGKEK